MTDVQQKPPAKKCEHPPPLDIIIFGPDAEDHTGRTVWCSECGAIGRPSTNGTRYWTLPGVMR